MGRDRKAITENQLLVLYNQVDSVCPKCALPLVGKKTKNYLKHFEVAHIYPLHPSQREAKLLESEEKLGDEVNDLDNLIPLCESCHGIFDKERTVDEYRELVRIKKAAIARDEEMSMWHRYSVEEELCTVIQALSTSSDDEIDEIALDYVPKEVAEKTRERVSALTRRTIRSDVRYYFAFLKVQFQRLEERNPSTADIIAHQVRIFALVAAREGAGDQLYYRVARWIEKQTGASSEAAKIVASFFVQNCEVFG